MKKFNLKNGLTLVVDNYEFNNNATSLILLENGEPLAHATTYLEELKDLYTKDIVTIKNYSENEGIEKLLDEVLETKLGVIATEYTEVPLYKIKAEFIEA